MQNSMVPCFLFSGKMPHAASNVPGGVTSKITDEKINNFQEYLTLLKDFIKNYISTILTCIPGIKPEFDGISILKY